MKCPNCGQWNRASFRVCQKCGSTLEASGAEPEWRAELKDGPSSGTYLRADEAGELGEQKSEQRDKLAQDMSALKIRKAQGGELQRRLRVRSAMRGTAPTWNTAKSREAPGTYIWNSDADQTSGVRAVDNARNDAAAGEEEVTESIGSSDFEPGSYASVWSDQDMSSTIQIPPAARTSQLTVRLPSRRRGRRFLIRALTTVVILGLAGLAGYFGYFYYHEHKPAVVGKAAVTASILEDQAAHTILIPGEDGEQIYIRELRTSYIVTGGFATVEVADHIWYDNQEEAIDETMQITLTPFLKTSGGQQKPLDPVTYEIEIPESPIELITPDSYRAEVAATMFTMEFEVRPGSSVWINDDNLTDTVNSETGRLSYNATVQPIGDNVFNVTVRSQYCRQTTVQVVLYRQPQDIPLDLAADTYTSTSNATMQVNLTTMPGAFVEVESPHTDLDISNIDSTGEFSFYAVWDHIGYNTITVTASAEGKTTSTLSYQVYYVPPASDYTPKAWPMNATNYAELLSSNIRQQRTQVYVIKGYVAYFVSEKPQMAVIYTSDDGKSQPVLVENYTRTTWQQGGYYRIYADAYNTYDNMPWLCARYTYTY